MLSYQEANLFLRAGDDMRFADWPQFDFVRITDPNPIPPDGYEVRVYTPTQAEIAQPKWRRA